MYPQCGGEFTPLVGEVIGENINVERKGNFLGECILHEMVVRSAQVAPWRLQRRKIETLLATSIAMAPSSWVGITTNQNIHVLRAWLCLCHS